MAKSRNIDISKVPKQRSASRKKSSLDITVSKKRSLKSTKVPKSKSVMATTVAQVGYFAIQLAAWRTVVVADVFQLSFVRNLFSLRVLFFVTLPIVVYQLRYLLVLKPDQILNGLRSNLASENTSGFIAMGLVIITLAIISWLADTLITPTIIRFRYQQFDNRRGTIGGSIKEASSEAMHNVWQKLVKLPVLLLVVLLILIMLYVSYVLGYGSARQQVIFYSAVGVVSIALFSIYFAFRFWLQTTTAVGRTAEYSRIGLAFKLLFTHPLTSLGYGLNWLFSLGLVIVLNFGVIAAVIYGLDNISSISLHIIILAGSTTAICIIWSVWTAWQYGYWTRLVHSRSRSMHLVLSHQDQYNYWHFLVLIIVILAIVSGYIVLAYLFSDQLNSFLRVISSHLPRSVELNLPKPQ